MRAWARGGQQERKRAAILVVDDFPLVNLNLVSQARWKTQRDTAWTGPRNPWQEAMKRK